MNKLVTGQLPDPASTIAGDVDAVYGFVFWICVFFFVLNVGVMTFFVVRYRRRNEMETTPRITHNNALEIAWSVGPVFLLVIMFFWGFDKYMKMRVPPADAMEIHVTAQRWSWSFTYPDGTVTNNLGVRVNHPVKLVMNSKDVIHSFFVPAFRQKMDVIPNRYTTTWFEPTKVGVFPVYCTEYCGTGHSAMLSEVHVLEDQQYEQWVLTGGLGDISGEPLEKQGEIYYKAKQCNTCHSIDGRIITGPSFKGIFGHEVLLADGRTIIVDENYIRTSIVEPQTDVVAGFPPVMPPYKGLITDEQITALIAYIKTLE
jgi:cytochrome c oxidase subunit 2